MIPAAVKNKNPVIPPSRKGIEVINETKKPINAPCSKKFIFKLLIPMIKPSITLLKNVGAIVKKESSGILPLK